MTNLPDYEPQKTPEGEYLFTVLEEPELRRKTSATTGDDFTVVNVSFRLTDDSGGIRNHKESFLPWGDIYGNLLLAFGAKKDKAGKVHLSDQESVVGKTFKAEIIHEPDRNDSSKTWARIANIKVEGNKAEVEEEDQDIPF